MDATKPSKSKPAWRSRRLLNRPEVRHAFNDT